MTTLLRHVLPVAVWMVGAALPHPGAARPATVRLEGVRPEAVRAPVVQGWTFTWKVSAETAEGKGTDRRTPPSMKVSLVPGKARIDYLSNAPVGQKKGAYMILDSESSTFTMVSPEDKTAIVMDPSALGSVFSAVGQSKLISMSVSGVNTSVEKVGAGEKILGHATTKYLITRDHTMEMSVLGRHNKSMHHSVTEAWYSNDNFIEDKAFEAWAKNFAGTLNGISGDAFKTLMEAEQKVPKGIVLKQSMKSTDTDDKGKVSETSMTMEMQEIEKTSLDASVFTIPADYKVTDMKAQMAMMSDSLKAAKENCEKEKGKGNCEMPSLDSAMKAGGKESAADAAKKKLKGLFKRP